MVDAPLPEDMPPAVRAAGTAIAAMTSAPDALPALLPIGLGDLGTEFDRTYVDTFQRIVLGGEDIRAVLDAEGRMLGSLMTAAGAACWPPDQPSDGPCPVN